MFGIVVTMLMSFLPVFAGEYEFTAPEEGSYATELASALSVADDGDVFILSSVNGLYVFDGTVAINADLTIISKDVDQGAILSAENTRTLFNIAAGKSLEIIALGIDANLADNGLDYCVQPSENYAFTARNVDFNKVSKALINASSHTASSLTLEHCLLDSVSLGTNLVFDQLNVSSCVFVNGMLCPLVAVGTAGSEAVVDHCVFDKVAPNAADTVLCVLCAATTVKNSSFSNNSYSAQYVYESGLEFDYNNFYNSADIGAFTGANCSYYNPQYDAYYVVTNSSLASKADDGKSIGPLAWVYDPDAGEDIDLGDNPYGFENQGVWIVPEADENGLWESYYVKQKTDALWYREDEAGNRIPDFSYCGYKMGNVPIPDVPVVATVQPVNGDAYARIQAVIDSVAQHVPLNEDGVRGAILLKAGIYNVSQTLNIDASGIVLRGEGEGESGGTVLIATSTSASINNPEILIRVGDKSGSLSTTSGVDLATDYVPVGAKYVIVPKTHSFENGDQVAVYQVFNDALVSALGMDEIADRPDGTPSTQWNASDYKFYFERQVRRISSAGAAGDSIIFYNPIVNALDKKYNASRMLYKASYAGRINNSGVENMLLKSVYASDTDENHAWNAVYFDRAEHCWATNITSKYFAYALANMSKNSKHISVENCTSLSPKSEITGGRRYSFNLDGQMCLVKNCYASEGRHDYVNGSRVCGPNVFTHCVAENAHEDIGPHHRWATGTLYDKITTDNTINVQDRGYYGSGHGWAGANMVFWGCEGYQSICQNPQVYAKNYNIGFIGQYIEMTTFGNRPRGEWEGNNVEGLDIPSLYDAQREDRGFEIDFGLTSNQIGYVNDSTFRLSFNDSLDVLSAIAVANYNAWGDAGISGQPIKVELISAGTVELTFASVGILKYGTRMDIQVSHITTHTGKILSGNDQAYLIIPDVRPVLEMERQTVGNGESDSVFLSSNKAGDIYLTFVTINPQTVGELEAAIADNKAGVSRDLAANESAAISTSGLVAGLYYAYAVDLDGRLSGRSANYVLVNEVSSLNEKETNAPKIYYTPKDKCINIEFSGHNAYALQLYDLSGRLLLGQDGEGVIKKTDVSSFRGLLLVKLTIKNKIYYRKVLVN